MANGSSSPSILAPHNWFGTNDANQFSSRILDRSDNLSRAALINYQANLSGPELINTNIPWIKLGPDGADTISSDVAFPGQYLFGGEGAIAS